MFADMQQSKTLGEIALQLAEAIGLATHGADGQGQTQLPTNDPMKQKLFRYVNRGYRRFLNTAHADWTFLLVPIVLTLDSTGNGSENVNNDPGKYYLPHYISSGPRGDFVYLDRDTDATRITHTRANIVDAKRQVSEQSGTPELVGVRRMIPSEAGVKNPTSRFIATFWPTPNRNFHIQASFRVQPYDMIHQDEQHISGGLHDETIYAAARLCWAEDDGDGDVESLRRTYEEELAKSIKADGRNRPKQLGTMNDPGIHRGGYHNRTINRNQVITHHNGVQIPGTE